MKWEDREKFDSTNMKRFIMNQGIAVEKTLRKMGSSADLLAQKISEAENVVISGAGDKYLVPLVSQYIWNAFGDKPISVLHSRVLSEYTPNFIGKKSLCIFLSQSGKTKDTLDAMDACMGRKAYCAGITNLRDNDSKRSFYALDNYDKGMVLSTFSSPYPEIPLPSTQTFHTSLALLNTVLIKAAMQTGKDMEEFLRVQTNEVPKLIGKLSTSKKVMDWAKDLAVNMKEFFGKSFYVFGDGPRYGIARKQAMVFFMEGVKNNACAIETEEFMHSAVETLERENMSKSPMLMLMPPEQSPNYPLSSKISSLWRESAGDEFVADISPFDFVRPWDGNSLDLLSPALYAVPLAWFTYYYALLRGVDPGSCKIVSKIRDRGL